MAPEISVGVGALVVGGVLCVVGWMLTRRFGAALHHDRIGRPYPIWHGAAAIGGRGLMVLGAASALVALVLLFV